LNPPIDKFLVSVRLQAWPTKALLQEIYWTATSNKWKIRKPWIVLGISHYRSLILNFCCY